MAKKAKKSKSKKQPKSSMHLELEGAVYIVTKTGKKVEREELDGELVLQCVLVMLEESLVHYERTQH